jgi:hypothetical protein
MNINIRFILIFLLCMSQSLRSQEELSPTANKSLLILEVLNPDDSPFSNKLVQFIDEKREIFQSKTNEKGFLKILLPIGNRYYTKCNSLVNERTIAIQNVGYSTFSTSRYTHRFTEFALKYLNFQNQPVKGEKIFTILSSGDTLNNQTNQNGEVKIYIPIKDTFEVQTKYNLIKRFEIPDKGYESLKLEYQYRGQSSIEFELEEEQNKLAEIKYKRDKLTRDSIKRYEDSVATTQPTTVIFFASDRDFKHLGEISVFDGSENGELLGTVNSVWSCHSGPPVKDAEVIFKKMKGVYTYYAKSTQGYVWEGTYNINGGGWKRIILEISKGKKEFP